MKSQKYTNELFSIRIKTENDFDWRKTVDHIETPTTVAFSVTSQTPNLLIKKITWDFGNGNKHKTITNRKQDLFGFPIECKYKKTHNLSLSIQASVFTDKDMFVTPPVETVTVNDNIRKHYVHPEEFKEQIISYYKTDDFSDEVADSIYKIANRLAFAPNFINYTYREEMVGDAVVRMVEALTTQKFDPDKGNPFSYFTKIAFHAFCNRIKKEKKIREGLANYQADVYNEMVGEGMIPCPKRAIMESYDNNSHYED